MLSQIIQIWYFLIMWGNNLIILFLINDLKYKNNILIKNKSTIANKSVPDGNKTTSFT